MENIVTQNNWYIKPLELPNVEKFVCDINNISFATTGFVHAWKSNLFFDEACQLIINAIKLFQLGYFDCAFYSLRQSIETSIGIIYLTANPNKEDEWKTLLSGFESGKMTDWLKNNEPTFMDIREKMHGFFDNVWNVQKRMNKYIHKQGYASFYQVTRNPFLVQQKGTSESQIIMDFEYYLKLCIGAVAIFRLAIDALPVVLMDEDIRLRTWDLITEPYSQEFVDTYIGSENIEAFKTTEIYKDFYESLHRNEKQNDAVYDLIHFQYYNREKMDDYMAQLHLCSFTDRIAMCLYTISVKISHVFVDGIHWYHSDVKSSNNDKSITVGLSYFEDFFSDTENDFNKCYYNVFLSRCQINGNYTYFEHNEMLSANEIECVKLIASQLSNLANEMDRYFSSLVSSKLNHDNQ